MIEKNEIKLYHTSAQQIENPDVNYGRRNADFGGGFYLSDSIDFAKKWASDRKPCINFYTFDLTGLKIKRLEHGEEWFDYITKNREGMGDDFADADVIIGPIANDTLYDTYGIITSGLISRADALKLLDVGKKFCQINIKSQKAISRLKWEGAKILKEEELAESGKLLKIEQSEFQKAFSQALTELDNFEEIDEILS